MKTGMNNGIGLVLAGGGGKGAYQIGVWKYLKEYGLDQYICGVSGTSVGALNAALFASEKYESAEELWRNITPDQILSPKRFTTEHLVQWLSQASAAAICSMIPMAMISRLGVALNSVTGCRYLFSRDGLIELIRKGVDFPYIRCSDRPCYVTCFNLSKMTVEAFDLRSYADKDMQTLLLASSAIPIVFDAIKFDENRYCDGGIPLIGDNVPIKPLHDAGVRNILVVHLDQTELIDYSAYPEARIIEITPQVNLGGAIDGVMDFTGDGALRRIDLGYHDAEKVFGSFVQLAQMNRLNEMILQAFQNSEIEYQKKLSEIREEKNKIQRRKQQDGFEKMSKEFNIGD